MSPAGWTDFLEQHLGRWSVPHLARGLVAMNAASWLLNLASPGFLSMLKLEPALVLQGEFWRVFTFVFVPPSSAHPSSPAPASHSPSFQSTEPYPSLEPISPAVFRRGAF